MKWNPSTVCAAFKKHKNISFRFFLILLMATCSTGDTARAQDTVLTLAFKGRLDSIQSTILKQKRFIQVFIPPAYKPGSSDKYDVLYVLDGGNWNTGLMTQIQRFVEGEGNMPPTIIVSVMGIDRKVELTPTHMESWKGSGGGVDFLGFITNELIPYINKTYPSNGDNTLWGHSLSGMFAIYALLNAPTAFKSFIAVDPSLWWDDCLVPKMAAGKLPALAGVHATLYISGREGSDFHGMRIDTMETVLKKMAPPGLNWKVVAYPDESHSSVRLKTIYDGLKFTYAGLVSDIQFHPMNGIVLKDKPIKIWYFDDTTGMHYTLDGTAPTESSPQVQTEISLNGAGRVTFKRFTNRSRYDKTVTGDFTSGKELRPVSKPKNAKPGGFSYRYYEGDSDKWRDLGNLKPVKTGITDKAFDFDSLLRKNNYAMVIEGFLETKEEGYYLFIFEADKNSKLYVGDQLLMEWDGNYNRRAYTYLLPLSKGFYPLRIEYLHNKEDFKLALSYLTPGIMNTKKPIAIPLDAQYNASEKPSVREAKKVLHQ
jgi:predicted alpha/beta superfamily hydrolase